MNPAQPVSGATQLVRVSPNPGDRKRRNPQDGELFRRALQDHDGERGTRRGAQGDDADDAAGNGATQRAATPTATALQRQLATSRREQGSLARHVDVLA